MAFKNIHVVCENKLELEQVINVLEEKKLKRKGFSVDNNFQLSIHFDGMSFIQTTNPCRYPEIDFKKFMEKYAMSDLKKKIEEAKKVTGLSASALSEKLGFQHKYLTNAVREASTQRQKEIIAKLDGLIFKEENELTHDFEGKALSVNIVDAVMVSKVEYSEMYSKNTALCVEVGHLKKELDHKNQVLDKRNAVLENHIERVNELELQLKKTRQKFIDVVDQKDSEIKKLQNDRNHATNQYHGKCNEVARLKSKFKNQTDIYFIIIVAISLIGIMGFAS